MELSKRVIYSIISFIIFIYLLLIFRPKILFDKSGKLRHNSIFSFNNIVIIASIFILVSNIYV